MGLRRKSIPLGQKFLLIVVCGLLSHVSGAVAGDPASVDFCQTSAKLPEIDLIRRLGSDPVLNASSSANPLQAVLQECYSAELNLPAPKKISVNGIALTDVQARNLQWIARCMMPFLPGSPRERAAIAAKTSWWSLREGVLNIPTNEIFRYSNCNTAQGDRRQSDKPLADCPVYNPKFFPAWQLGIAASQTPDGNPGVVNTYRSQVFSRLGPNISEADVLAWTANLAGYPPGTPTHRAILESRGHVRFGWLVRNPLIGAMHVAKQEVDIECFQQRKDWCFGGSDFARNSVDIQRSVDDLTKLYLSDTFK